jgi:hypothetical protein
MSLDSRQGPPNGSTQSGWLSRFVNSITHRDWIEAEAEVRACVPVRNYRTSFRSPNPQWGGYVVDFTYFVAGQRYDGLTNSLEKMEEGDHFVLRYNPDRPEQNNTFDAETAWAPKASRAISIAILLFFVGCFLWYWLSRQ